MSTRMMPEERKRFDILILSDDHGDWTFEAWEEKNHNCCVVCVVRKGDYIAREHRLATEMLLGMINSWYKGLYFLEEERIKSL